MSTQHAPGSVEQFVARVEELARAKYPHDLDWQKRHGFVEGWIDAHASATELRAAAEEARAVLSALYAQYSTKIGPYATQAQRVNVLLGAAIAKAAGSTQ